MKNISRKITFTIFLILFAQTALFSAEKVSNEKSSFQLGKEVAQLKFELFKIEKRLGEYKDMSDFKLFFVEAKKEHLLRKRNSELLESVDNDKAKAKEIIDNATKKIFEKAKELKDKSIDFYEYIKDYFKE